MGVESAAAATAAAAGRWKGRGARSHCKRVELCPCLGGVNAARGCGAAAMAAAAAGAAAAAAAAGRGQDVAQKLSIVPAAMVAAVVMAVMEAFTGCGRGQLQQLPTDAAAAGGCGGEAWWQALLGMVGWAAFRCATLCGCADGVLFACIYTCALTYCSMVATMRLLSLPWHKGGRVHDGRQHINMRDRSK